jgi:hypothetical protein
MSKGINLMGSLPPGPKPIFPVLGPRDRVYSTINLKPELTPFMAFFENSILDGSIVDW